MASYNCGYSHVQDAQQLAMIKGLDSTVWDDHVEKMIIALSYPQNYNHEVVKYGYVRGLEPYEYVDQIFKRYEHYQKFID
jgi:membrane-bound lytic murein transglycosylase F